MHFRSATLFLVTVAAACASACASERASERVVARDPLSLPPSACAQCHQGIVESHAGTAHARTSAPATNETIHGDFTPGHNVLLTRSPFVSFTMERRADGFYQRARDLARGLDRSERFDIVVGSGRRGQSYIYWNNEILYELPVSYWTAARSWMNSPGYQDGTVDFGRVITTRCLECHATSFEAVRTDSGLRYAKEYQLGISCEKCHGDARAHVTWQVAHPGDSTPHDIVNPARIDRDRRVDVCALCHSGGRPQRTAAFTYRAGERLEDFLFANPDTSSGPPDVHGNQVGLLRGSQCFLKSPNMSCETCHDLHREERDADALSGKCLQCHAAADHAPLAPGGPVALASCATCHMPVQRSNALQINTATSQEGFSMRSHRIAVYPPDSTSPRR